MEDIPTRRSLRTRADCLRHPREKGRSLDQGFDAYDADDPETGERIEPLLRRAGFSGRMKSRCRDPRRTRGEFAHRDAPATSASEMCRLFEASGIGQTFGTRMNAPATTVTGRP